MKKHILKHVVWGLAVVAAFSAAMMLLWNCLMPSIFGLPAINLWQALGLLVLARILLGGMIGHTMSDAHYKNHIRKKFKRMSSEERRDFIKHKILKHGCDNDFFQHDESEKHERGGEIKT